MSLNCLWCYSLNVSNVSIYVNEKVFPAYLDKWLYPKRLSYLQLLVFQIWCACHFANISKVIWYERVIFVFSCLTFGSHLFIG
jgi:hypothetical protein